MQVLNMRAKNGGESMANPIEGARTARGFTQEQVAKSVGIPLSSYNQYETGARSVPADIAERIAQALRVEVSDIFLPLKFSIRE